MTCGKRSNPWSKIVSSIFVQITALEKAFSRNPYPNSQSRQLLSGIIGVPEGKVKVFAYLFIIYLKNCLLKIVYVFLKSKIAGYR